MPIPDPLNDEVLKSKLNEEVVHEPLIEGLLYRNASLMISSEPGFGKSVLAVQAMLQMAAGIPVFGALHVSKPLKVWYVQMERSYHESLERIKAMSNHIPITHKNLFIDVELQSLSFLNQSHFDEILLRAKKISADVCIIDPLYGLAEGLSKDEVGSRLAKLLTMLKKETSLSLWVNHHTVKQTYEIIGDRREKKLDPFYGAQWLKAHMTGTYLLEQVEDGTLWSNRKDSHGNLLKTIKLTFDQETYLSSMDNTSLNFNDRAKLYINSVYRSQNPTFFFEDLRSNLGCTISPLRGIISTPQFSACLSKTKSNGKKTLYTVLKEI